MQARFFDSIGQPVSLLGFGCMRLPLAGGGIDFAAAQALVDRAIAMGVNYFDTAWPYHEGNSETFLGQALQKHPRDAYFLADKMPSWEADGTELGMEALFERQLEKCRTGYFDFYLVHCLTRANFERCEKMGMYAFLSEKKREGKIRRLGFSFHDSTEILGRILAAHPWDFVQLQLNYLDWEANDAQAQYALAVKHRLPVIVMEPVRGGLLAALNPAGAAVLQKQEPRRSVASWAIRFAASLPGVLTVLSGMSDTAQLEDNLRTLSDFTPLSQREHEVLQRALEAYRAAEMIPCTSCRYCDGCPAGIDIPSVFAAYNSYCAGRNRGVFARAYGALPETSRPDRCTGCGRCAAHCPQQLDIGAWMKKTAALAAQD